MLRRTLFVFSLILFSAYPIAADPFVITAGSATFLREGVLTRAILMFSGQGIGVNAVGLTARGPNLCTRSCLPGSIASLSYDLQLDPTDFLFGSGGTINGVQFAGFTFNGPFLGGTVEIPFTDAATVILTTPFTLNGAVHGSANGSLFGAAFTGSGYATVIFRKQAGEYLPDSLTYNFVPVPEPATIFLLASGLGILAARLRSRSRL